MTLSYMYFSCPSIQVNIFRYYLCQPILRRWYSVSLVISNLVSEQPWQARGIKLHKKGEIVEINGCLTLAVHP